MTPTRVVNGDAVAELVAAGGGRLSQPTRDRLTELGIPLEGRFGDSYPAAAWAQCVMVMAADLFPAVEATEAQRRLAHLRVDVVAARWRGRALFAIARLAGPQRGLARFVHALRSGASYIDTRFTVIGPRHYEVWISDVTGVPGFFWGMIEAGARHSGGRDPISIKGQDGDACTYEIKRP